MQGIGEVYGFLSACDVRKLFPLSVLMAQPCQERDAAGTGVVRAMLRRDMCSDLGGGSTDAFAQANAKFRLLR